MQYFGGKQRIAKPLSGYLNNELKNYSTFVDLFCGSCNVLSNIDDTKIRIGNDKHFELIALWKK